LRIQIEPSHKGHIVMDERGWYGAASNMQRDANLPNKAGMHETDLTDGYLELLESLQREGQRMREVQLKILLEKNLQDDYANSSNNNHTNQRFNPASGH